MIYFVCLGFYAVSTVFQLFNSDSSQIHVSWTIFNQYLTSPLSWHWWASCCAIPIILSVKGESYHYQFLAPLAVGQRSYVMVRCPSCVRPSILALTFSLNIFFSETTYQILMKFHRNVPAMVLFRISWKNLILSKTVVAMATKLKKIWKLWKSSCQKP